MDLGREIKSPEVAGSPSESKEPKITYPSFTLNDKAAEEFCKEHECELGKEYAFTGKLKVTGHREDEFGKSITFDVKEIDDMAEEHTEGDEKPKDDEKPADDTADKDEEKILGYKKKKSGDSGREKVKASADFMDTP
jgi:hypothetical protein